MFVNNFDGVKQQILWIGGPLLALFFGVYYLGRPVSVPKELKMYASFIAYTAIGFFFVSDVELMYDYWKLLVSILILIFCISVSYKLNATLLHLLFFLWLACALVSIYSIYVGDLSGFFSGQVKFRPEGGFIKNPNGLANYARIGILCAILILTIPKNNILIKRVLQLYIPLATILIIITASRGAFVNTIIVFGLTGWVFIRSKSGNYLQVLFILLMAGVLGYFFYVEYIATSFLSERFTTIDVVSSDEGVTTNEMRFRLFLLAADLFRESLQNAFFGIGLNQFRLFSGGLISHSEYSDVIVTTGLIGTYLYYSIYFILWKNLAKLQTLVSKNERRLFQVGQAMIISELLYGLVNPNFLTIIEMVFIFILVGFSSFELKRLEFFFTNKKAVVIN